MSTRRDGPIGGHHVGGHYVGGHHRDADERDPEAPAPDLIEQATPADPDEVADDERGGEPARLRSVHSDLEVDEYDAIEQSLAVPYDDDYR